jgi:hypothetical protein
MLEMALEISKFDKDLINIASTWTKSKKADDKRAGEYLLDLIIHKYLNELLGEDSYTLPIVKEIEYKYEDSYKYQRLSYTNLIRKCEEINTEMRLN